MMPRRLSAMSGNLADPLDLNKCMWFSIQCDTSVDNSSTAQLLVFIHMAFEDYFIKTELLALLPLKTTPRGIYIYSALSDFFLCRKRYHWKSW